MQTRNNERLSRLESYIRQRGGGRVDDLRLQLDGAGLILHGRTHSYHVKQLAQHAVMEASGLTVRANRIRVAPRIVTS